MRTVFLFILFSTVVTACKKTPDAYDKLTGEWDWIKTTVICAGVTIKVDPLEQIPPSPTLITFYRDNKFKNNSQCSFNSIRYLMEGKYELLGILDGNLGQLVMFTSDPGSEDTMQIELYDDFMMLIQRSKDTIVVSESVTVHEFKKR